MSRVAPFLLALGLVSAPALAQQPPQQRPPTLLVQQEAKKWTPLKVTALRAEVDIAGLVARARVTMTFANPNDRVLEGELVFPLPDGASISGYGLDVKGVVVGASAVERTAARVAFETEVRQGVDPGLVEWVRGNVFRTRVYPVPAKGHRTIRVEYLVDLSRGQSLRLPLTFGAPIDDVSVAVTAHGLPAAPTVTGGTFPLAFAKQHGHYLARATARQRDLGELVVTLPRITERVTVVGQRTERGRPAHYFHVSDVPPSVGKAGPPHAEKPRRIAVVWDASLSRLHADRKAELAVLAAKLKAIGDVEVDCYVVRDRLGKRASFTISGGDSAALIAHLTQAPIDGGSRLDALTLERQVDWTLLVTDGLGTLGDLPAAADRPIYAMSASPAAHHALLRALSTGSGGSYVNLRTTALAGALRQIGMPPGLSLVGVDAPAGSVANLLPSGRQPVDGRVAVSGKLLADEATLTLRYSNGAKHTVTVRKAGAETGGLVPRLWASMQVAELALLPDRNRAALIRVGKRFGLVTPHTSLLVLETLQQHLTHGILPPKSRPEMRKQYIEAVEKRGALARKAKADKLAKVGTWWAERMSWYGKTFTYPKGFRYGAKKDGKFNNDAIGAGGGAGGTFGGRRGGRRSLVRRGGGGAKKESAPSPDAPKITIKAWDPKTPYMARLKDAGPGEAYAVYLAQRKDYAGSPAYYLDCSEYFLASKQRDLALRVLTSILELEIDDAALLRVVAHRLQQLGEHGLAIHLFERVRRLRAEEPQSHRDLALALVDRAEAKGSTTTKADYQRAAALLEHVVRGKWNNRFPRIEVIALTELNRIRSKQPGLKVGLPSALLTPIAVDIRILLTWDADMTDIDLWVIEPSGEKCMYNHNRTTIGGAMTRDFTRGYGPEVYLVRKAMPGTYKIQCNFYGSSQQKLTGGTTIQATVITNYGRPNESRKTVTVRLAKKKDVVDLGAIAFGKAEQPDSAPGSKESGGKK